MAIMSYSGKKVKLKFVIFGIHIFFRNFNLKNSLAKELLILLSRNIVVEDPRPTLQHFMVAMEGVEPWSHPEDRKRDPGDLFGILFQVIIIKH